MPRVVVGLIGEKRGGKSTAAELLKEVCLPYTVESISSGRLIYQDTRRTFEILKHCGVVPATIEFPDISEFPRHGLIDRAKDIKEFFGKETIARGMTTLVKASNADIVLYDAVRWDADAHVVTRSTKFAFLYVTADFYTRLERARRKAQKGEAMITEEEFRYQENEETERDIPRIGAEFSRWNIGHKYVTSGTLEEFRQNMQEFFETKIKPILL